MLCRREIAQTIMARFVFVVLALLAAQALSDVVDFSTTPPKVGKNNFFRIDFIIIKKMFLEMYLNKKLIIN